MLSLTERPKIISEMAGQKSVLQFMKESSRDMEYPPFMLFYGASGIGKSTLAFILAKTVNCKNPIKNPEGFYDPCNECKSCQDVNEARFGRDIHYMDASKMGKAEVSQLSGITNRLPMYDKKRVIIIDEAHLLNSKEARGAMLLILEKPIDSVLFILCTTDISKFDNAFMNRLQKFKFRAIDTGSIGSYLGKLFNQQIALWDKEGKDLGNDGIEYNGQLINPDKLESFAKEVIPLIAFNSQGALRQALQYYEQCVKMFLFTKEEVLEALDFFDQERADTIMLDILNIQNTGEVYEYLKTSDISMFYNYLYKTVQESFILQNTGYMAEPSRDYLYQKFIGNPNLQELFRTLLYIEENKIGYNMNSRYIISRLLQFMFENQPSNVKPQKLEEDNNSRKRVVRR